MLKSMTGYGQGSATGGNFKVTIDLRSVNNRYLDINWRAPQELVALEIPLRKQIRAAVSRGRVDVTINFTQTGETLLEPNRPLIRGYLGALRAKNQEFGLMGGADLAGIARLPNVLQPVKDNHRLVETVVQGVEAAFTQALAAVVAMRAVEGSELQKELFKRIERIESLLAEVETNSVIILDTYRKKMRRRLAELLENVAADEIRVAQEVAYLVDRSGVTEEIARLKHYLGQSRELLAAEGEIGKKIDFLLQEMNREANSLLSKSAELAVSETATEIKTEVEKLREQALNIE